MTAHNTQAVPIAGIAGAATIPSSFPRAGMIPSLWLEQSAMIPKHQILPNLSPDASELSLDFVVGLGIDGHLRPVAVLINLALPFFLFTFGDSGSAQLPWSNFG